MKDGSQWIKNLLGTPHRWWKIAGRSEHFGRYGRLLIVASTLIWVLALIGTRYWRHANTGDDARIDLFLPIAGHWDFMIFAEPFRHFRTEQFYEIHDGLPFAYPAASGLLLAFFFCLFQHPYYVFQMVSYVIPVIGGTWLAYALVRRGQNWLWALALVTLMLVMSYPWQFEWQRSNIESLLFVVTVLAIAAFWNEKYWLAAGLIGFDTAAKLYPFILLGLLVARKRYRQTAFGLLMALAVNSVSLWLLGPSYQFANHAIQNAMKLLQRNYVLQYHNIGYDHSLMALFKCFLHQTNQAGMTNPESWLTCYMVIVALAGLLLYWFRIRLLPRVNQVVLLVTIQILIPPVSYDYTLIHLYIALGVLLLYIQSSSASIVTGPMFWMVLMFAVLLSPEGPLYFMDSRISGQLKCCALITVVILALRHPLYEDDRSASAIQPATVPSSISGK